MEQKLSGHVSFDSIEENGLKDNMLQTSNEYNRHSKLLNRSKSMEILHVSIDLRAETHATLPKQSPIMGYSFMFIAVIGITINHLFAKIAFYRNKNLTNYDGIFFLGLVVFPTYLIAGWVAGMDMNIMNYRPKAIFLITVSIIAALSVNFWMLLGISMISIGKSTLIFDLSPLFCIILAFILLAEKLDAITIFSALGSFWGIYFLTLNKSSSDGSDKSLIMGILLVFAGAWIQASIMILVRMINIYKVHFFFRPLYSGMAFLVFTVFVWLIAPHKLNIGNYTWEDIIFLGMSGVGCAVCVGPLVIAFRYEKASRLAPINYIENVFTLLSDVLIFKYTFVATDYVGMIMIAIWLVVPATWKIINEK